MRLPFRLFGFPLELGGDAFFISIVFIALAYQQSGDAETILLFTSAVVPAVVVHELGHAFEARRAGGRPVIRLGILGGETSGIPGDISDWRSAWIAAAGVVYSFAFLGAAWLAGLATGSWGDESTLGRWLQYLVLINGIWALVQLLPIGPLDGTAILEHVLAGLGVPGTNLILIVVSSAFGVAVIAWLVSVGAFLGAAYAGYLSWTALRGRLSRHRWETDARRGWADELRRLDEAGDHGAVARRAAEMSADARSPQFRLWLADRRIRALLLRGGPSPELERALEESTDHPATALLAAGWLACGRPGRALSVLGERLGTARPADLAGDPALLGVLVQALASSGERGELWELARAAGLDALPARELAHAFDAAFQAGAQDIIEALRPAIATAEPGENPVETALLAVLRGDRGGIPALEDAIRPGSRAHNVLTAVLGLAATGEAGSAADLVVRGGLDPGIAAAAQVTLHRAGAYREAARVGRYALERGDGARPDAAYNLACSLARLGDTDGAIEQLQVAGSHHLATADLDADLAALHDDPRFRELVERAAR